MSSKDLWFNFIGGIYHQNDPPYFDCDGKNWAIWLQMNHEDFSNEIMTLVHQMDDKFKSSHVTSLNQDASWKTLSFKTWGIDVQQNELRSSIINKFLKSFPEVISASINILSANSYIQKHMGDTNGIYRVHLGISVPDTLPNCGFEVNGIQKSWKTNKILAFCDAYEHWAWNHSNERRIIFCFDVIREEYLNRQKEITLKVRAFLIWQMIFHRFKALKKFPSGIQKLIIGGIKTILLLLYPLQKKFGTLIPQ